MECSDSLTLSLCAPPRYSAFVDDSTKIPEAQVQPSPNLAHSPVKRFRLRVLVSYASIEILVNR
jgi:hypothetical protein